MIDRQIDDDNRIIFILFNEDRSNGGLPDWTRTNSAIFGKVSLPEGPENNRFPQGLFRK